MMGYFRNTILNENKLLQSYVIGLAIGDGNLSNPNGRAVRLRITCDKKYPLLIRRIIDSLQILLPQNKVSVVERKKGCLDISVYSNHLEKLLGWQAAGKRLASGWQAAGKRLASGWQAAGKRLASR